MIKNEYFKKYLSKMLQLESSSNSTYSVKLQDEKPIVILGPLVEDWNDSSPRFYTSLNIHDNVFHDCLMYSGASHNLMPKTIMDDIGMEIKKACHDLYSFDSRKVKCLGVIKYLFGTLFQFPMKSVVMDIVVDDVPSNVWDAFVNILDQETRGNFADGPFKCHHSYIWRRT
jgi:hypothetical protein